METEPAAASEDLHHQRHGHNHSSHSNHSRHSSGGDNNVNNNNNNNNNNSNNNNSDHVDPDLSSEDGDFGSADEIGSEEASAWIARASRSLCEDSEVGGAPGLGLGGAAGVIGAAAGGGGGGGVGAVAGLGLGVVGPDDGSSPPLQGEVTVSTPRVKTEPTSAATASTVDSPDSGSLPSNYIQWLTLELAGGAAAAAAAAAPSCSASASGGDIDGDHGD